MPPLRLPGLGKDEFWQGKLIVPSELPRTRRERPARRLPRLRVLNSEIR
jgi:hypothetical protein